MSNNNKFNPELLGFYAIVIVLTIIVSLSAVEGGKWIYNKFTGESETTTETDYGPFYTYEGKISKLSYESIFSPSKREYYVLTLDITDDFECESCGEFEEAIIELLDTYVANEDIDSGTLPLLYIMNLNSGTNNKILGDENQNVIIYDSADHGYKDLKIDSEAPISIIYRNGDTDVDINNSAIDLQETIDYLMEIYYYECEECEEETETTSFNLIKRAA